MTRIMREFHQPEISFETAPWGMQLTALRPMTDELTHVRITHAIFPATFVIPLSETLTITQMHVPVDDTHTYWYSFFTSFAGPLDKEAMRAQRLQFISLPDYIPKSGRHNHWGFNPEEQLHADLPRHGRGRHQPARPVGGGKHGPDPGPHPRAPGHQRQGDHGQPPHAAQGDRDGAGRRQPRPASADPAQAGAMRGPDTVDGIAPAAGWQRLVPSSAAKRAGAAWLRAAAPVLAGAHRPRPELGMTASPSAAASHDAARAAGVRRTACG